MATLRFALVFVLLTIVSAAFAASYQDPRGRFAFDVPSGWSVTATDDGTTASDGAAAYARIVKVPGGGKDKGVVDRVTDQIGTQWQNFTQDEHGSFTLAGQRGIYLFFSGVNPRGVQATMRVVAAPFGEDAYMIILSCPTADFSTAKAAFKQIENSFKVTAAGAAVGQTPSTPATAGSLPAHAAPEGLQTFDVPDGGRILYGKPGDVSSGPAAFKAGLRRTRGYFDSSLNLLNVVRSKGEAISMASFSAVLRGVPVGGLVIAVYDPDGNSRCAVLFDTPDHLAKSLPLMLKHFDASGQEMLERARPSGGKAGMDFARFEVASKKVALNRVAFQDGTASIGVASGFTPQLMSGGRFTASSADGAYITLFRPCNVLDPDGTLYKMQEQLGRNVRSGPMHVPGQVILAYDSNPVSAWKKYLVENARQNNALDSDPQVLKSALIPGGLKDWPQYNISGTMTVKGEPFVFTGMLVGSPPPSPQGGWSVQVTLLAAPTAHAATDMPAMIAMQQSEKVDMNAVRGQTMRNIAAIQEQTSRWLAANKAAYDEASQRRFESAMANARASRDAMDRSTAGFINHIRDVSVVQHNPTGAHATLDNNLASALEQADPQHFSVVPLKQYIKGVDY